jgi:hypothetical protein
MKSLISLLLTLLLTLTVAVPAMAADYEFGTGGGTLDGFGTSTSTDATVTPDLLSTNTRRNKDAAVLPPPYGIFSGDIPTDPKSPYHNNLPESSSVPAGQELPPVSNEDCAPGSSNVTTGLLPSTSQTMALNSTPWYDMVSGAPLAGANIRIQGYFAEGNANGMPIDLVQVTGGDGKSVFEDLPAGQYTVTELEAPAGYQLDRTEYRSISLTWGQTASTSFYDKPKTFVEVIKVDGDDSGKVRLGAGGGSFGNQLVEEKLYILTEVQAPKGYVLDPTPVAVLLRRSTVPSIVGVLNVMLSPLVARFVDGTPNFTR